MLPKFSYIPQPIFPSQRDNEKVFVFVRRYLVRSVMQTLIVTGLFLIPIIFFVLSFEAAIDFINVLPVFVVDLIILVVMAYYLALLGALMYIWMRYYYTQLVVTNERIYETIFQGFFSLVSHEFGLSEIVDCTYNSRGIFAIIFNIGVIVLHLPRGQQDYQIREVQQSEIVANIISQLAKQAQNTPAIQRQSDSRIIGLIENQEITKSQNVPLMNLAMSISGSQQRLKRNKPFKPKSLREKFDLWWYTQIKKEHMLYIDYKIEDIDALAHSKGESEKTR